MQLQFKDPGADAMIESVMAFQTDGAPAFWSAPLYHFYPQLDREYANQLDFPARKAYIGQALRRVYAQQQRVISEKILRYSAHWEACRAQIEAALSDAFAVDCSAILNDMVCHVSMNPICPRSLQDHTFDVFYLNSERGAIGMGIHEIIHFVWFHVWHQTFGDAYDAYEQPSLKWILSEMAVEPVMRDERLAAINPYFPKENGGCVYPYFYTLEIKGRPVLDVLADMYRSLPITAFMRESYAYCAAHEEEIRRHIQMAEG